VKLHVLGSIETELADVSAVSTVSDSRSKASCMVSPQAGDRDSVANAPTPPVDSRKAVRRSPSAVSSIRTPPRAKRA